MMAKLEAQNTFELMCDELFNYRSAGRGGGGKCYVLCRNFITIGPTVLNILLDSINNIMLLSCM